MRNMSDIIEDCKLNKPVDKAELKYSVIALTALVNMTISALNGFYKDDLNALAKRRIENVHQTYHSVLNLPPKIWLGWNNDPENPDYQKFHAIGSKLVELIK